MKRVKCINANVGGLTEGKVYDVVESAILSQHIIVLDDSGKRSMYESSRFLPMPDWEAIGEKISGFLGWAEPEPDRPSEDRYAISKNPTLVHKWVRVCPGPPNTTFIWSTSGWYGQEAIVNAQADAIRHKKKEAKKKEA